MRWPILAAVILSVPAAAEQVVVVEWRGDAAFAAQHEAAFIEAVKASALTVTTRARCDLACAEALGATWRIDRRAERGCVSFTIEPTRGGQQVERAVCDDALSTLGDVVRRTLRDARARWTAPVADIREDNEEVALTPVPKPRGKPVAVLSGQQIAGWSAIGGGVGLTLGGVAVALGAYPSVADPSSPGETKEAAIFIGRTGLVVGVLLGVVTTAIGGFVLLTEPT